MEVYSHHGVLWITKNGQKEDVSGTLSIVDVKNEMCLEWKPSDVSLESDTNDQEWTVINTGHKKTNAQGNNEVTSRARVFVLPVSNLHSFRVTKMGHQLLLQDSHGIQNKFLFQNGNADNFVAALRGALKCSVFKNDRYSYQVLHSIDSKVLDQSFAELHLFPGNKSDYVWKFVQDFHSRPYETTLTAFSKLTDAWLYGRTSDEHKVEEVAELLTQSWNSDEPNTNATSDEYEVIGAVALPQYALSSRGPPLSVEQWVHFQDKDGSIRNVDEVKNIIFKGGIDSSLRYDVWKYLLGYFPWDATDSEKQILRKQKTDEYFRMKLQWKTISPEQEERFSDYRDRKSLIEKDAKRTDRTIEFFMGEDNPNLQILSDILMTYVMYNFDLGYVQGMSDLLSPILCLMTNEADAFWCFVGFMNRVSRNFDLDQSGIKTQLSELQTLLSIINPELTSYIRNNDSGNMFFCFRWLLVLFKREFSQEDIMKLWEVLWTDLPCENFHLLICAAILDREKKPIVEGNYGFTEILKHVNDLSMKIELDSTLCYAETLYNRLNTVSELPESVCKILGLQSKIQCVSNTSHTTEICPTASQENPDQEETKECVNTSLLTDDDEMYDRSLNFNYL